MDIRQPSVTYKLRSPLVEQAMYFTIVGEPKPIAFFINSKNMDSFQWITAFMTSISKQINADIPIENIIEDMKNTFDPNGDYTILGSNEKVNGIVHHLGLIIEKHVKSMEALSQ